MTFDHINTAIKAKKKYKCQFDQDTDSQQK